MDGAVDGDFVLAHYAGLSLPFVNSLRCSVWKHINDLRYRIMPDVRSSLSAKIGLLPHTLKADPKTADQLSLYSQEMSFGLP